MLMHSVMKVLVLLLLIVLSSHAFACPTGDDEEERRRIAAASSRPSSVEYFPPMVITGPGSELPYGGWGGTGRNGSSGSSGSGGGSGTLQAPLVEHTYQADYNPFPLQDLDRQQGELERITLHNMSVRRRILERQNQIRLANEETARRNAEIRAQNEVIERNNARIRSIQAKVDAYKSAVGNPKKVCDGTVKLIKEGHVFTAKEQSFIDRGKCVHDAESDDRKIAENTRRAGNLRLATTRQAEVTRLTEVANTALEDVENHFEMRGFAQIRNEIIRSGVIATAAVSEATAGSATWIVQTISQYAVDKITSVNNLLAGVSSGLYESAQNTLITAQQVATAIYENPTLLTNLGDAIVNQIVTGRLFDGIKHSVIHMGAVLTYGSANDRGKALGGFAWNVMLNLSFTMGGLGRVIENESLPAATALGGKLNEGLRANVTTQPLMEGADAVVAQSESLLRKWKGNHMITSVQPARAANSRFPGYEAPYQEGTNVVYFSTRVESQWVRVHNGNNEKGSWVMKKSAIRGLSSEQIQTKFAIPERPTHISDVVLPPNTSMSRGSVQYHPFPGLPTEAPSGAVQYRLEGRVHERCFKNKRSLPEVFNE